MTYCGTPAGFSARPPGLSHPDCLAQRTGRAAAPTPPAESVTAVCRAERLETARALCVADGVERSLSPCAAADLAPRPSVVGPNRHGSLIRGPQLRRHGWRALPDLSALVWQGGFDGAGNPNPGPAAWGAWLDTPLGDPAWSGHGALGHTTHNVAEWQGLLHILTAAHTFQVRTLQICGDSQLVIRQFTGEYAVKQPPLHTLADRAHRMARQMTVTVQWVPREQNPRADALSQVDLAVPHITFDAAALDPLGSGRFVAHGTHDYVVDLTRFSVPPRAVQAPAGSRGVTVGDHASHRRKGEPIMLLNAMECRLRAIGTAVAA